MLSYRRLKSNDMEKLRPANLEASPDGANVAFRCRAADEMPYLPFVKTASDFS